MQALQFDPAGSVLDGPLEGSEPFADHVRRLGSCPAGSPDLVAELEASQIRGRGGAGFPAARKWAAVLRQPDMRRIVVANGAEGEPCSGKDRLLLRSRPHLVLDGLQLAAETVGARETFIYLRHGDKASRASIERALRERRGSWRTRPHLIQAPARYVASEETAVIARIEGRAAKPRDVPPRPYRSGVNGHPTLMQNVETLARIALIARGLDAASSALMTVHSRDQSIVLDVTLGTPLGELVATMGGDPAGIRAALVGGYFGAWIDLATGGAKGLGTEIPLGAGVVALLDTDHCGVAESARVLKYLASQSAQQCGPCTFGLPAMAHVLEAVQFGRAKPADAERAVAWTNDLPGRGACRLPDGASRFAASSFAVFAREVNAHLRSGPCRRCAADPLLPTPALNGGWK